MTGRDPELMMIGDFASSVGLTASALRFYADSGVLEPAEIDPVSGYRLYSADQHDTAVLLRRLRDLDLLLPDVRRVLSASPGTAARIIEEHVSSLIDTTAEIRRTAEELIAGFPTAPSTDFLATFRGFSLAEALDQVLTATVREPGDPRLVVGADVGRPRIPGTFRTSFPTSPSSVCNPTDTSRSPSSPEPWWGSGQPGEQQVRSSTRSSIRTPETAHHAYVWVGWRSVASPSTDTAPGSPSPRITRCFSTAPSPATSPSTAPCPATRTQRLRRRRAATSSTPPRTHRWGRPATGCRGGTTPTCRPGPRPGLRRAGAGAA